MTNGLCTNSDYFYRGGILFHRTPHDKVTIVGISDSRLRKILNQDLCDVLMSRDETIYGSIDMGDIVVVYPIDLIVDIVNDCEDEFEKHMWMTFLKTVLSYMNHIGSWQDVAKFFQIRDEDNHEYMWFDY